MAEVAAKAESSSIMAARMQPRVAAGGR
jgi:hypothetical protein